MMVPVRLPQRQAFDLSMTLGPFAPMRRLNVDALCICSIDPLGSIFVTREDKRVDDSIVAQGADFEVSISWRNCNGKPFCGQRMHDVRSDESAFRF
jgi:hypothetical protein